MRRISPIAVVAALACTHARTPEQDAMIKRADCVELLRAADAARAADLQDIAAELAAACPPDKLADLVAKSQPEEALLWCGRAAAARQKGCEPVVIAGLAAQLRPALTLGPSDPLTPLDPLLWLALQDLGRELNLTWDAQDPDVIVGKLLVTIDHTTTPTTTMAADAKGNKVRIPATQHRFLARAEAQVEVGSKTRTLRAHEEARDLTWEAPPRQTVAARYQPEVPPEDELKKRAVMAWLRSVAKALAANPPEGVDVSDARGCVAYGLSINLNSADAGAAARGVGDPAKVSACEKLLGEPAGAGIPVP